MSALARRRWLNLGLLGLAGLLAALALFEPGRDQRAKVPSLLELAPARVERIVVERPGQETLAFELRQQGWWMTAPATGPVNPVLINPILHLPEARCPRRYAAAGLELKQLQLEPPRMRLWLNDREIRFGATSPTDGQRYLQVGTTVHVCPDSLYSLLISGAAGFLAPSIESLMPKAASSE